MIPATSEVRASLPAMRWPDFQRLHPDAWVIVEVVAVSQNRLQSISVIEHCADPEHTVRRYRELRRADPARELCFLHTAWGAELEERWQFSPELRDTVVTV